MAQHVFTGGKSLVFGVILFCGEREWRCFVAGEPFHGCITALMPWILGGNEKNLGSIHSGLVWCREMSEIMVI